jgi:hypothetical protein
LPSSSAKADDPGKSVPHYRRGVLDTRFRGYDGSGLRFSSNSQNNFGCKSTFSRRNASEFCAKSSPSKTEGAGNAGRPLRPQPRVQNKKAHERIHHGHTGNTRHSPRNGFTAYIALSPVTGLVCHRRLRKLPLAGLTPASGRQDHTTSPSASALSSEAPPASIASRPAFVTITSRPSVRRDAGDVLLIWACGEAEYFSRRGWTVSEVIADQLGDLPDRQIGQRISWDGLHF